MMTEVESFGQPGSLLSSAGPLVDVSAADLPRKISPIDDSTIGFRGVANSVSGKVDFEGFGGNYTP